MTKKVSRIDIVGQNGNDGLHYGEMTDYQQYIATSRYARYLDDEKRRETWDETVDRYINFFNSRNSSLTDTDSNDNNGLGTNIWDSLRNSILSLDVMPSMRCLMTAGKALERDNVAGYNCSYRAVDDIRAFDEIMYVLLCGTGVGFSVERQFISELPAVAEEFYESDTVIQVKDSKIGWASAYRQLVALLYAGDIPKWDMSKIRPAGSRLKTFGGRASGPEPLVDLFEFSVEVFKNAKGRKLNSVECHDLVCKVADIVVVGGVRRSALISLSNLTDERMRVAKSGQWWDSNPQRALANNSVCYTEKPDMGIFMKEWESLYESKSGERGIFSREASKKIAARSGRRDVEHDFGTNPCSEIILRSKQFCNLTEAVVRPDDDLETLKNKVRIATILGTLQSTLTNFRYLGSKWKRNTEEERLLGVSLTGIMDHPVMSGIEDWDKDTTLEQGLNELKEVAIETNKLWADKMGIEPSTAITCVKPSGTVSQLVDSASGIHPRYSDFYIRTVRTDKKDPVYSFLKDEGVPVEDAIGKEESTAIFSFPVASPKASVKRNDVTAIDQLELWRVYAEHWCEHKPSITVYVREDEWLEVGAWVYKHFDLVSGVSFLPHTDHVYKQAPYQEITEEAYKEALVQMPDNISWDRLATYETEDNTTVEHELACTAGGCEIL
jgi:ribonucleoside-diphosphate reductase alpha chain